MFKFIYSPIADYDAAKNIAQHALAEGMVACVNILPKGESFYMESAEIKSSPEYYMLFKTSHLKCKPFCEWLEEHHPYDTPAILSFDVKANQLFSQWVQEHLDENKS